MSLTIDVVSDVVCPWCFVGKRKLERALELYREQNPGKPEPTVQFHPYELNPDLPEEGVSRKGYYEQKFGPAKVKEIHARLEGVGKSVGIPFALESIPTQPNTRRIHALIELAGDHGVHHAMKEAFMKAFFIDAIDLSKRENIEAVAVAAGIPADAVKAHLDNPASLVSVEEEVGHAKAIGVQGVPFFIFNQKLAVSGAQDPDVLLGAMAEAEQETA